MTDLHCDRVNCVYLHDEHCTARAVYYIKRMCMSYRERVIEPPPMICRDVVHQPVPRWRRMKVWK